MSFEFNERIFLRSASNCFLGPRSIPASSSRKNHGIRPYIIAPSYVKIPAVEITYLMIDALAAIKESEKIIVIGCGLRPGDSFLWLLLTSFLKHPNWRKRKVITVSPNANKLIDRIKLYWCMNVNENFVVITSTLEEAIDQLTEQIAL